MCMSGVRQRKWAAGWEKQSDDSPIVEDAATTRCGCLPFRAFLRGLEARTGFT
jgi:hypothetical protein